MRNGQPLGAFSGLGISPLKSMRFASSPFTGRAPEWRLSREMVIGVQRVVVQLVGGRQSTICPRYITAMRLEVKCA